jgi:RNA polymerase sigma-70 factor (ECF subfamily)
VYATAAAPHVGSLPREATIDSAVIRAQRGDGDAFATLYDAHAGRVHAICLRMSGDPVRAADLVQEVFIRAWQGLGTFRGEAAFGTWLHRLAVNVVLQLARGDTRRRRRVVVEGDLPEPGLEAPGADRDVALRLDLEDAVATLPHVLREVFVLHDVEGYRHEEIGALLDLPVGTCRSHLFRARRRLREMLR